MLNRKIKALLYADTTWLFGEGLLGPLFAVFAQRVGGNLLEITWAWSAYLIIAGILIILIGKLSDRKLNKEKLVVLGYALNAFFTFCYLFVSDPLGLLLVQAGLGVAVALATPTWNALYSEYEDRRQDGYTWGLADGMSELATGLAILAGGMIVAYVSFSALFVIMGSIQVVSVVLLLPVLRKRRTRRS